MKHWFIISLLWICATWVPAKSYVIYPIPQHLEMGEDSLSMTPALSIVCDREVDEVTRSRTRQVLTEAGYRCQIAKKASTKQTNVYLSVDEGVSRDGKYDSYTLIINSEGISITGQHTNAVFFALASFEQILEQQSNGVLPYVTIEDYADLQNRGVVEGYYGFPYNVEVRKDLMRFMMRYKMNTYLYGGKSDPFHSQYWQQPYPETITEEQEKSGWMSQSQMSDIAQLSTQSKVNFIWAIHPGDSFIDSETAVEDILSKYTRMYQLGVRQFALFVDDVFIPTETSDMELTAQRVTALQRAIEQRWNQHPKAAHDTVRPLHFVPQIYCSGFADSDDQRIRFMKAIGQIPEQVTLYTTGQWVWTVPNCQHTANVRKEVGRPMAWWWNYPCNDNADSQIYASDMYSNFVDMPAVRNDAVLPPSLTDNLGLLANPMQQGEVAKTPLFSVADYAWNNVAFDSRKSWEASFVAIVKQEKVRQSYRFLSDYLRWSDPWSLGRLVSNYQQAVHNHEKIDGAALRESLSTIIAHCDVMEQLNASAHESDRLLYVDLRPWLHILKAYCQTALSLMDVVELHQAAGKVETIESLKVDALAKVRDLSQNPDYTVVSLEGMADGITTGQRQAQVAQYYLSPFVDYLVRVVVSLSLTK